MTPIYENKGYVTRQNISLGILVMVSVYGVWELWNADLEQRGGLGLLFGFGGDGYIFGALFVGGGIYGLWQIISEASSMVASLDLDEATGETRTVLWRPFRSETLTVPAKDIRDWRFYVKLGNRNLRTPYIYANYPNRAAPLIFDMRRADVDGLRKLAPDAVAEYETATGVQPKNVS